MANKLINQQCIEALRTNNRKFIHDFYKENFGNVRSYVLRNGGTHEDAKDIMQSSMLRLLSNVRKSDFVLEKSLGGYFFGICKNTWLEQIKQKSDLKMALKNIDPADYINAYENTISSDEVRINIYLECITMLNPICKAIITMRDEKISYKEIAKKLKLGAAGVARIRKHRCLEKIKAMARKHKDFKQLGDEN